MLFMLRCIQGDKIILVAPLKSDFTSMSDGFVSGDRFLSASSRLFIDLDIEGSL